jgi:glucose dehydrogenase
MSAAPLVEGDLLIVCAGGEPDACILAFDKNTGAERWKRAVAWAHPAYAKKHVVVRNDKELLRASLAAEH